jgi:hypothetical protein
MHNRFLNGLVLVALLLPMLLTVGLAARAVEPLTTLKTAEATDGLALRPSDGPGHHSGSGLSGFSALSGSVVQGPAAEPGGWAIERVDAPKAFYAMTDRSLRLDAAGHPHIAYGDDNLYYARHDGATWHRETVDDAFGVGSHASLALDEAGYPHISYYDDINEDLKVAYQDAAGWHIETVDSAGDVGQYTSLALDASGYPHISYYGSGDLKFAYQDAAGWQTQTVDSGGGVGQYTSLALDGSGYPHISYHDWGNDDLKYAYQDVSGWHTQTVDSDGNLGRYTSLALDASGYPHISYHDWGNYDLKYAHQDASGWHIQAVDSTGNVGSYSCLALDGGGYPHVSYYDLTNEDLKYAVALPPAPTLYTISHPDGGGDYTVDWSTVSGADTYTLQEDDNDGFSNPTEYTLGASQFSVGGQDPGTWYYRVKASIAGRESDWSSVESVTVASAPIAAFAGTPTSGMSPLTVDFISQSTGSITSWSWDFGDGSNSNAQNPSHTYDAAGDYTVSLTVSGPGGSDTETKNDYVHVEGALSAPDLSGINNPDGDGD